MITSSLIVVFQRDVCTSKFCPFPIENVLGGGGGGSHRKGGWGGQTFAPPPPHTVYSR